MNASSVSINLSILNFRTQVLGSLTDLGTDAKSSFADILSGLKAGGTPGQATQKAALPVGGSSSEYPAGFNMALNDPMSAYAMMTKINLLDVTYKTQYSELSKMDGQLPQLAATAQKLGDAAMTDSNSDILAGLQDFIQQYNAWVQRFRPDVQPNGPLSNVQAGELPLYELDQVIENRFIGAKDGLNGLADLGISIDANTGLMSINTQQFDAALANNRQAVMNALGEFSAKFASEANLLASDDNLIQHRLNNLNGAIGYIDGSIGSWQKEFGMGDPARPTGKTSQALATYAHTAQI